MKLAKRLLALLLAMAILIPLPSKAESQANESVLTLPGAFTVIEEEAFMDSGAFDHVILPEGVTDIQAKAFAGSSLQSIQLPSTLTYIADDAFEGSQLNYVIAPEGSYAYNWTIEHGYPQPLTAQLSLTAATQGGIIIEEPGTQFQIGDEVSFHVTGEGGLEPYAFTFDLYLDDLLLEQTEGCGEDTCTYCFTDPGEYRMIATMTDQNGTSIELQSETLTVVYTVPTLIDFSSPDESFKTIKAHAWNAQAAGGIAPYEYKYVLTKDNSPVYVRDYSQKESLYYTFFDTGNYTLTVTARDALGIEASPLSQSFSVSAGTAAISGVVRMYVDVDSDGRVIESNSATGYYELQIINSEDNPLAYDDHLYVNPAFSFHSGENGIGIVAISNGDHFLRDNSSMYTYTFSTTADKLKYFLSTRMEDEFLSMNDEVTDEAATRYTVKSGDFMTYSANRANCFTAVAYWGNWLGFTTFLKNDVYNASNYTDYLAWKLLRKYAGYWNYEDTMINSHYLEEQPQDTDAIEVVITLAEAQLGMPYVYAGGYSNPSPNGFDCSGLVHWSYYFGTDREVVLESSAYRIGNDSTYAANRVYRWQDLKRGDVLCFKSDSSSTISHIGLYLGNGRFIHASSSSKKVIYSYFNYGSSASYWTRNLVWGYSVL